MAKVRVEWVRLSSPGFGSGAQANDLAAIAAAQVLTVGATAVQSSAAPAFPAGPGGDPSVGFARVAGLAGAVNIAWGAAAPASETAGVRLEAGRQILIELTSGQTLSLIEAADAPGARAVQDAASETALASILAALAGGIGVAGPLTAAQLTAAGLATSVNQGTANTALGAIQSALQATLDVTSHPVQAEATSRSGAITVGGTAQDLMPANATRKGWRLQNQSTGDLYIRSKGSSGTTAATADQNSLKIEAGATWTEDGHVSPSALSIIGSSAGQAFYAREW